MTQFLVSIYRKAFIDTLPMVKFPLTHAMCDKNDYENLEGDDYVKQVVDPVSKELAARVISQIEGPLSETECDIKVGLA